MLGKRRNLLQLALTAHINGDDEFVAGLDPDLRREILKVYAAFDEVAVLVRSDEFEHLRDLIPRIVDELMCDGWSETAAGLVKLDYKDIPVTPRQFLTDPYYAGRFGEGLYPVNFRDACWLLNPKNRIFEVVLTGSTRWGKTTLAVLMAAYRLYLLSMLRDPQSFFGLMRGSSIRYGVFNIFKYKTGDMHQRIQSMIDECPYFVEQFPRLSGERSKELVLPNHVSIVEGATELHALGETFIGGILDEVNFMRSAKGRSKAYAEESLGQAQKLYGAIRGRLRNQFVASPGNAAPYFMCLLSQRRAQTDFLEEHIEKHGHEEGVAVVARAIWDVQPEGTYSGKTFRVFCGDDTAEPRILKDDEGAGLDEANVITAPLEHQVDAENDLEDFIRNIAGRATVAASALFHRPEVIFNNYDPNLVHPFKTQYMVISTNSPVRIQDAVREDLMFETHLNDYRPRLHYEAARVMHIDLAVTGCSVGIACVHMWAPKTGGMPLTYLDFALRIDPPPYGRGEVDFDKIIDFIEYLTSNGYVFQMVSLDKYQSRHFVQRLHKMGITADFVSVDETDDPYINLRGVYESGLIRTYPYEPLETELRHLSHDITEKKVFKPLNGSKDVSDAVCGAVYGLIPPRKRANKEKVQKRMPVGGLPQAPAVVVGGR